MQIFYTPLHKQHNTPFEIYDGAPTPYAETPDRIESIARTLRAHGRTLSAPHTFGSQADEYIAAIHQPQYVNFLRRRSSELSATKTLYPSYFMSDTYAPIVSGTFRAARAAVDVALSGAQTIVAGEKIAYSLCRPPGHHASHHSMGGYCYFNNAAIAAHYLSAHGRVAILDIDFHHGNGTQDAFYDRADVLYVSLHADPAESYPYSSGFADEHGRGKGIGFTQNYPLPKTTTDAQYLQVLQSARQVITNFTPDFLVVSAGFDTYQHDPIGGLKLTSNAYHTVGHEIAGLGLPLLIIQEGGYDVDSLPTLVSNFVTGVESIM